MMRNPQIHNTVKQGLVSDLVKLARQKGSAAYSKKASTLERDQSQHL